jgi:hypothetical protein
VPWPQKLSAEGAFEPYCPCVTAVNCTQVENFGRLRYERSREALEHGRILTQRHEATDAELAMAEGDRRLVSG